MRFLSPVLVGLVAAIGCAPHGDEPRSLLQPPTHDEVEQPLDRVERSIVVEAEPPVPAPPVIAPRLPDLAPSRPLAHLAPLWHDGDAFRPRMHTAIAVGNSAVALDPSAAAGLGLGRVAPVTVNGVAPAGSFPLQFAGPLLLLTSYSSFAALEAPAKVAWTTPDLPARSYIHVVGESMFVASHYGPDADHLLAWALHDGREQWSRVGSPTGSFTRIKLLWADENNTYLLGDRGLLAFDPVTGASTWDITLASPDCGVATGEGFVVVENPDGYLVLDAATGIPQGRLPDSAVTSCAWMSHSYQNGVAPGIIAQGRLFALEGSAPTGMTSPLRAYDLRAKKSLWRVEGYSGELLVADHDAVFVNSPRRTLLVALDAASGRREAEISIGAAFYLSVEPVGGAAGPLLVLDDDDLGQWILGRTDPAPVPEAYVIRGRLIPEKGLARRRVAGVRLIIGEEQVRTDKQGRFSARGTTLGVISVGPPEDLYNYQDDGDEDYYTRVTIDPQKVELQGKGTYDLGDIVAYEVSME